MYFILKDYFTIEQISEKAIDIYKDLFSEKQFRAQLSYFKDIDYSEQVEYLVPVVNEEKMRAFLVEKAIDILCRSNKN